MIYQELKEEIIGGRLHPGERLLLSDIASRYQVSPVPIREALQRLKQDSFVTIVPHVGARVVSPNLEEFKELTVIRTELEAFATQLAALLMDEGLIQKLQGLIQAMEGCVLENDKRRYSQLNREFHTTIYAASQNRQLYALVMNTWEKSQISGRVFAVSAGNSRSLEDHKEIFKALVEKNPEKAANLMRAHNETAFRLVIQALEEANAETLSDRTIS
jgi:DNA-binding GntR family transcriptional regulator